MNNLPAAISLGAIQAELAETKSFPDLEQKVRLAMKTQSCQSDLKEALDSLTALNELRGRSRGLGSRNREVTESALFRMTILLYARATITNAGSGERGPIQIHKHLDEQQLLDHQAIIDVRNMAQAHVYPNEEVAKESWHRAFIYLMRVTGGWLPAAASNRILIAPALLNALNRQVPIALSLLAQRTSARLNEVSQAISRNHSPELNDLLSRHPLDLITVFGNEMDAKRAVAGALAGHADWSGVISER